MSPRLLPLILLLMCSVAALGRAQGGPVQLRPGPSHLLWQRPSNLGAESAQEPLGGLLGRGDLDYRYTGFFVGTGLGLGLAALTFIVCADTDSGCDTGRAVPLAVLMVGVTGLSGAVIGGFVPKTSPP
jgi:hypothetical protein